MGASGRITDRTAAVSRRAFGIFVPKGWVDGQDIAEFGGSLIQGFSAFGSARKLICVVAADPQKAGTQCLNCYPSPEWRRCAILRRPPFFRFTTRLCSDGWRIATPRCVRCRGFDGGVRLVLPDSPVKRGGAGAIARGSNTVFAFSWQRLSVVAPACPSGFLSGSGSGRRAINPSRANADPLTHSRAPRQGRADTTCQTHRTGQGANAGKDKGDERCSKRS